MNPAVVILVIGIILAPIIIVRDIIVTRRNNKILKNFRDFIKPNDEFTAYDDESKKHKKYIMIFKEDCNVRAIDSQNYKYKEFKNNQIYPT